jgi:hypothetical protein
VARYEAEAAAEDPHRVITDEHELVDVAETREHDQRIAATDVHTATGAADDRRDTDAIDAEGDHDTRRATDPIAQATHNDERPRAVDERESTDTSWDIRQDAAAEPARDDGHDPDVVRVPSSDETAESVRRAQRALTELKQRQAIEDRRAADDARERDDELAHWREDDDAPDVNDDHRTDRDDHKTDRRPDLVDDTAPALELSRSDD